MRKVRSVSQASRVKVRREMRNASGFPNFNDRSLTILNLHTVPRSEKPVIRLNQRPMADGNFLSNARGLGLAPDFQLWTV